MTGIIIRKMTTWVHFGIQLGLLFLVVLFCGVTPGYSNEDLLKATQNPVADLISVPIQNITNFNIGPYNRTENIVSLQPVIPMALSEDWLLVTRIIMPIGKSYLAALIHELSPRREHPFITVNLGALPEHLAESELFGHAKGAYTGADLATKGLVAAAEGGTLFFDEIEAAPISLQVKILRLVEQKQYLAIGSTNHQEAKVRIIAASNRDLTSLVACGEFRDDLYYRLADIVITIPPLREMPEEIAPLTQRFVQTTCAELRRTVPELANGLLEHLATYQWKGNIRELKSVIRRTLLAAGPVVEIANVKDVVNRTEKAVAAGLDKRAVITLRQAEEEAVRAALQAADGRFAAAARLLDIDYSRFKRLLDKHDIAK